MEIGSTKWRRLLTSGAASIGVDLSALQVDQFTRHAEELMLWNKKINLTAIKDPADMAVKHFLDSLAPFSCVASGHALLDIGSGGGFPGIPLKVAIPSLSVTLIDASRKKTTFLQHIVRCLKLDDINVLHARAQDLAEKKDHRRTFDVIISRALSSLESYVDMALPLAADGGHILSLKGKDPYRELEELDRRSRRRNRADRTKTVRFDHYVIPYTLPFQSIERTIIGIKPIREPIEKRDSGSLAV